MDINHVLRDVIAIRKHFRAIIQGDQVAERDGNISWYRYSPGIASRTAYVREYQSLLDSQQYSFLFLDGSFVQFFYAFSGQNLTKARLAFYPVPIESDDSLEELFEDLERATPSTGDILLEHIERIEQEEGRPTNVSHVRIDYDAEVTSHCRAHMQFGGINNFRISSKSVLLPLTFMETVAMGFFPSLRAELHQKPRYIQDLGRARKVSHDSALTVRHQCFLSV